MNNANLALEGGDPREPGHALVGDNVPLERQLLHSSHDPSVSFEEYMYYAAITRAEEKVDAERYKQLQGPKTFKSMIKNRFSRGQQPTEAHVPDSPVLDNGSTGEKGSHNEKGLTSVGNPQQNRNLGNVTDAEWKNASRAIRTAGWSSVFYLITTDILGPFSTPWAFAQMGYGPGVTLYTVFGGFAMYSGFQLWKIFMYLDSDRYPMKTYADAFFRVYGTWARHSVNLLQAIQLLLTVSVLTLSNGQSISQISKGTLCFIACLVIFMAAGFIIGQIRTLQRFGWLANFAVWLNVLILFIV
jgi:hypothetical protein